MNTLDSVRYVDTVRQINNNGIEAAKAPKEKVAVNSVDINSTDLAMIEQASLQMQSSDDADLERVAQMKEKIANGEVSFDMRELARAFVRN